MVSLASIFTLLGPPIDAHATPRIPRPQPQIETWLEHEAQVYQSNTTPNTELIGDWEPVSALLVGYNDTWSAVLEDIITHANVPVWMVTEETTEPIDSYHAAQSWRRRHRSRVQAIDLVVDSAWTRDYGPFQRRSRRTGEIRWLDAHYDAERSRDDLVPEILGAVTKMPVDDMPYALDGGAMSSNGAGLCVSTVEFYERFDIHEALVPEAREKFLHQLGCATLILLPALPDEQTAHVDMFVQFTAEDHAIVAATDAARWPEAALALDTAAERLRYGAQRHGVNLKITRVDLPWIEGEVFYSYVNGVRINDRFLVPRFPDVSLDVEMRVHSQLRRAMPGVHLIPIDVHDLPEYQGLIHCIVLGLAIPRAAHHRLNRMRITPRMVQQWQRADLEAQSTSDTQNRPSEGFSEQLRN